MWCVQIVVPPSNREMLDHFRAIFGDRLILLGDGHPYEDGIAFDILPPVDVPHRASWCRSFAVAISAVHMPFKVPGIEQPAQPGVDPRDRLPRRQTYRAEALRRCPTAAV